MTPEERQMLAGLFERTRSQAMSPRDHDAEAFIADGVRSQPYAPYLFAQAVIVQEQALRAAAQRIEELEAHARETEAQGAGQSTSFLGSIGQSLFGAPARPPAPGANAGPAAGPWGRGSVPQQPLPAQTPGGWGGQPQQAAPWQQQAAPQSGGFLKGALGAAAGVAGGVLLADSIRGLMGGHSSPFGIGSGYGGGLGGGETVNNYYSSPGGVSQDQVADMDRQQDALQDQTDDYADADQQQDALQDQADYTGGDSGGYDGGTDT